MLPRQQQEAGTSTCADSGAICRKRKVRGSQPEMISNFVKNYIVHWWRRNRTVITKVGSVTGLVAVWTWIGYTLGKGPRKEK